MVLTIAVQPETHVPSGCVFYDTRCFAFCQALFCFYYTEYWFRGYRKHISADLPSGYIVTLFLVLLKFYFILPRNFDITIIVFHKHEGDIKFP